MSDHHEFSANKIFAYLIFYTAVEVLWGMFFPRDIQWALWGGLLLCAFLKGYLIFTWFMHMKFEGWIVKGLVLPTIPLIAILLFGNMPDSSFNDDLLHHIGDQLDPATGEVVDLTAGNLPGHGEGDAPEGEEGGEHGH
jgi:cytochrome c oxidase subunit IV